MRTTPVGAPPRERSDAASTDTVGCGTCQTVDPGSVTRRIIVLRKMVENGTYRIDPERLAAVLYASCRAGGL